MAAGTADITCSDCGGLKFTNEFSTCEDCRARKAPSTRPTTTSSARSFASYVAGARTSDANGRLPSGFTAAELHTATSRRAARDATIGTFNASTTTATPSSTTTTNTSHTASNSNNSNSRHSSTAQALAGTTTLTADVKPLLLPDATTTATTATTTASTTPARGNKRARSANGRDAVIDLISSDDDNDNDDTAPPVAATAAVDAAAAVEVTAPASTARTTARLPPWTTPAGTRIPALASASTTLFRSRLFDSIAFDALDFVVTEPQPSPSQPLGRPFMSSATSRPSTPAAASTHTALLTTTESAPAASAPVTPASLTTLSPGNAMQLTQRLIASCPAPVRPVEPPAAKSTAVAALIDEPVRSSLPPLARTPQSNSNTFDHVPQSQSTTAAVVDAPSTLSEPPATASGTARAALPSTSTSSAMTLKCTASGNSKAQAIELVDDDDIDMDEHAITAFDAPRNVVCCQSRVFPVVEFVASDFATVHDGLNVARRSKIATASTPTSPIASAATASAPASPRALQVPVATSTAAAAATTTTTAMPATLLVPRKKAPIALAAVATTHVSHTAAVVSSPPPSPPPTQAIQAASPSFQRPSMSMSPAALKPRLIGDCSAEFLTFMRDVIDHDEHDDDDEQDDESTHALLHRQLLEVVDLTNLTDSSDDDDDDDDNNDSSDGYVVTVGGTNSAVPPVLSTAAQAAASAKLLALARSTGTSSRFDAPLNTYLLSQSATSTMLPSTAATTSSSPTALLQLPTTTPVAVVPPKPPRQMEPCVLCDERRWVRSMIHCPTCRKFYHKRCAKEYGDDSICWNCELDDMIDDSELTDTARDEVVGMLRPLRPDTSSSDEGDEDEGEEEEEEQMGEEEMSAVAGTSNSSSQSVVAYSGTQTKSMQRWKAFLDDTTSAIDDTFHAVTQQITAALASDSARAQYSVGFTTPESFQNAIANVLDSFADLQDRLDKEAKEKVRVAVAGTDGSGSTDALAAASGGGDSGAGVISASAWTPPVAPGATTEVAVEVASAEMQVATTTAAAAAAAAAAAPLHRLLDLSRPDVAAPPPLVQPDAVVFNRA